MLYKLNPKVLQLSLHFYHYRILHLPNNLNNYLNFLYTTYLNMFLLYCRLHLHVFYCIFVEV